MDSRTLQLFKHIAYILQKFFKKFKKKLLCFFFLFIELALVLSSGVLVLLVLTDQIVHVGLGFSEFHLVHTFTGVPVQESLPSEHSSKLLTDPLKKLLNSGRITNKRSAHFQTSWRNIANSGFHVIRDPFNKVTGVFVLNVQHLFVDLFHAHSSSEHGGNSQVSSVSWVASGHHVFSVEHLLGEFWNS